MCPQKVGILGGMGPAAGAEFVRLFVRACADTLRARGVVVHDQAFPEHWLAQVPVPDRSRALAEPDNEAVQPFEPMCRALEQLAGLGVRAVAIACNTAHAWHAPLQARFPQIDLLHIADETARFLAARGVQEAALMATVGTYDTGLYDRSLARAGIRCRLPSDVERADIMSGIYEGVKAGDLTLAGSHFAAVATQLESRHPGIAIIMGCTEVPLALPGVAGTEGFWLVDPAAVLAAALARRAYKAMPLDGRAGSPPGAHAGGPPAVLP